MNPQHRVSRSSVLYVDTFQRAPLCGDQFRCAGGHERDPVHTGTVKGIHEMPRRRLRAQTVSGKRRAVIMRGSFANGRRPHRTARQRASRGRLDVA